MLMTIWKRDLQITRFSVLIILAILSLYTTVIVYMYDPSMADVLNQFQSALPQLMSAVGMSGIANTLIEWIQIYLYGFIMLLFPMVFTVVLVSQVIMKDIDHGSLASMLMLQITRRKLILIQMGYVFVVLFLVMAFMSVETILISELLFPGELDIVLYLKLNGATLLIWFSNAAIALFGACFVHRLKPYYLIGAGIPLCFFLCQMISNIGEKLSFFKYASLYCLLPAQDVIENENILLPCIVVFVLIIGLCTIGTARFVKRDFYI